MALVKGGFNALATLLSASTFMYLGIGNSSEPFNDMQTGLLGNQQLIKHVDAGYPVVTDNTVIYRVTFDGSEANFMWSEWGLFDAISNGTMLNRTVEPYGIKEEGQSWALEVSLPLDTPLYFISAITFIATDWMFDSENNWYTYPITNSNIIDGCKVDLILQPEQVEWLIANGIAITTINNNGITTAYSFGSKPSIDISGYIEVKEVTETITLKTEPDVVGWEFNQSTGEVIYTDGAVNFASARMNYETDTFDYGSWEDSWLIRDIKPCVLKNGIVQYYLDKNDNTKKVDGTPADITSGNDGDVMVEFPMCYYKLITDSNGNIIGAKFSLVPQDDTWCTNAFLNEQGIPQDVMYHAMFDGFVQDDKLRSLSGKTPTVDKTIGEFRGYANANGAGYEQQQWAKRSYIFALWIMVFKNPNSQEVLGKGVTSASAAINTGTMNQKGMFWGDQTGTNGVKAFGIENLWGNTYKFCDGLMNMSGTYKYKIYAPYNDTASGYLSGGTIGGTKREYINAMMASNGFGLLPSATIADEPVSNYHDALYYDTSDTYTCSTGGYWGYGSGAGLFYMDLSSTAPHSSTRIGAFLSFTPQ